MAGLALHLDGVAVTYPDAATPALAGVSLHIDAGEWVCLIGPNGAGKSTLLAAVAGLTRHQGRVAIGPTGSAAGEGRFDRQARRASGRSARARQVALVPQSPVIPTTMAVADYVLLGRTPHLSYFGNEGPRDRQVVADALERLALGHLAGRPLGALSGGELQRVVLARALAQQAPVLLLDEPTSALDLGHQQRALELVDELRCSDGLTVLAAMHDLTLAGLYADRLVLLDGGRAVAQGAPNEVLVEAVIAEHYGASVRVLRAEDGTPLVVPARPPRTAAAAAAPRPADHRDDPWVGQRDAQAVHSHMQA